MKIPALKWIPPLALAGLALTAPSAASASDSIGMRCYPNYVPSGSYSLFTAFTSQDIYPLCRAVYEGKSNAGETTILVVNLENDKPVAGSERQIGPLAPKAGYEPKLVKVNLTAQGLGVQIASGDRYGVVMWLDINNQITSQRPTLATDNKKPLGLTP